ncbi:hypothetical protein AOLI_G00087000 [Acnodon oligacanthus]
MKRDVALFVTGGLKQELQCGLSMLSLGGVATYFYSCYLCSSVESYTLKRKPVGGAARLPVVAYESEMGRIPPPVNARF